jgi:hypothetical protein
MEGSYSIKLLGVTFKLDIVACIVCTRQLVLRIWDHPLQILLFVIKLLVEWEIVLYQRRFNIDIASFLLVP